MEEENEEVNEVHTVLMDAGHITLDTGCKRSVASRQWHEAFQEQLRLRGMSGRALKSEEQFRFGDGRIAKSTKS